MLAHGGVPGLIAETGGVVAGLAVFGFFLWRSAKKDRERDSNRP